VDVRQFTSAEQLLSRGFEFDLVLLDIKMGGMDGMEAAKRMRAMGIGSPVVFLTGVKENVFDAFEVDAVDYLLKPVDKDRLFRALRKAFGKNENRVLTVKRGYDIKKVDLREVVYIEAINRKLYLHTKNGVLDYYEKLDKIAGQLGDGFFRPHRSYVVNMEHVKGLDGNAAIMDNGDAVPVAKARKSGFKEAMLNHFRRQA